MRVSGGQSTVAGAQVDRGTGRVNTRPAGTIAGGPQQHDGQSHEIAFEAGLVACLPNLRRYARRLVRGRDRVDDLVQDTVVRALAKRHLFQPGSDQRAWLFTLMHNLCASGARAATRDVTHGSVPVDWVAAPAAPDDPGMAVVVSDLRAALERLPDGQRRALLMIGAAGERYDHTAEMEGVPIGTIRSRMARGRDAIRLGDIR